jgi:uroporphyrinogen III methyltransferase/synthase
MMDVTHHAGTLTASSHPLFGKTVLVTRPQEQAQEFSRLLTDRGANVVSFPTIQIVPPQSWEQCDKAINDLERYDVLILTSTNAVKFLFQRIAQRKQSLTPTTLTRKVFYTVGSRTAEALSSQGVTPTRLSEVTNAHTLVEALLKVSLKGKRCLFAKGNLAGSEIAEVLRRDGVQVDEVTVYETAKPSMPDVAAIAKKLRDKSVDIVAFFSPSSVKHFVELIEPKMAASATIAVIGTSTSAAARKAGFDVQIVPLVPTSEALLDAITAYFKEREVV